MKRNIQKFFFTAAMLAAVICQGGESVKSKMKQPGIDLRKVRIFCKSSKSALSYREKEPMVFEFKADFSGFPSDGYYLSYVRRGDDGKEFSGKIEAGKTLVVKTSLDAPGFVSVNVCLLNNRGEKQKVEYVAGAAVKPELLEDCGEPADFDKFWEKQKSRLKAVPFRGKVTETPVGEKNGVRIFAVSIPCVGRPATGYLTVPSGAKAKSLPAEIVFDGYGAYKQPLPPAYPKNRLVLRLNAHGQELGKDAAYYKKFFGSLGSRGYSYAKDPEQNRDPETAYFNGMVFRALRGLDYLKSRPEWDGRNLAACGTSQGGLQTIWAAALEPDVNYAWIQVPWCCDLAGAVKKGRLTGGSIGYSPGLDYYDPVFMAKRIKFAEVKIHRAGLGDYICPPSGVAIFYKNLATQKKSIKWGQGGNHYVNPEKSEIIEWKTY